MRRISVILSFSYLCFISCNPDDHSFVHRLESLYQEKFTLSSADNHAPGKEKSLKLVCSDNSMVEDGSLLPEAMANNCAIVIYLTNKALFETNPVLEVEISADEIQGLSFDYQAVLLDSLARDYLLADSTIKYFIASARSNDPVKAKNVGYNADFQPEQSFISFMNEFREQVPPGLNAPQILGFTVDQKRNELIYSADVVLPSIDNFKKWINISLVKVNDEMKIKEVKF